MGLPIRNFSQFGWHDSGKEDSSTNLVQLAMTSEKELLNFMSAEISKMMIPEEATIKLVEDNGPLQYSAQYVSQPSIWKRLVRKLGFCRG